MELKCTVRNANISIYSFNKAIIAYNQRIRISVYITAFLNILIIILGMIYFQATIGNGYWVKKMVVAEANINAQPSIPGHNRLLSGKIIICLFHKVKSNNTSITE